MKQKLGIIGAGGLIGSRLSLFLDSAYDVRKIKSEKLYLNPEELVRDLENLDIIINLAGYPVSGRWNDKIKKLISDSRIVTTHNLVNAINLMKVKPVHYINASAVGIYADGLICNENTQHFADNFLAKVVADWEKEASGVENVNLTIVRIGVVLSRSGGAYALLRKVFKAGAGGIIGSGEQGFSFILIDDLIAAFGFIIENNITGIINAVSPNPVNNKIFTKELASALNRPSFLPVPEFAIRLLYGEGSTTVLHGQKAIPSRLVNCGFKFVGNNLKDCLKILEK